MSQRERLGAQKLAKGAATGNGVSWFGIIS